MDTYMLHDNNSRNNIRLILLSLIKIIIGGAIYYTLETITRGFSHWTMFILGGLCFLSCGLINTWLSDSVPLWAKMVLCMIVITVLEFVTGIIVNGLLGWNIWNYSRMPLHVLGQICVPFMFLWYVISYPALLLNRVFDYMTGRRQFTT